MFWPSNAIDHNTSRVMSVSHKRPLPPGNILDGYQDKTWIRTSDWKEDFELDKDLKKKVQVSCN